jgi:hypothetical protein
MLAVAVVVRIVLEVVAAARVEQGVVAQVADQLLAQQEQQTQVAAVVAEGITEPNRQVAQAVQAS